MRRRELVTLLGGAAAAWPLAARAQEGRMPVIGFLGTETPDLFASRLRAFHQGLSESGFAEGRNVRIEYRWAEGRNDQLPALATDLVRHQVSVIATGGTTAALAAKAASPTVPIIFLVASDPVAIGLVVSIAQPGYNATGVSALGSDIGPKHVELLHELLPSARSFAVLINPTNPAMAEIETNNALTAARTLGLQVHVLRASSERDLDFAFASIAELGVGGLVIGNDLFFNSRFEKIAALTLRHRVPAVQQYREFAAAGGLMSYGAGDLSDAYRQIGIYACRILKGEKASKLPVTLQSTKVELVINLKTAKALGIEVPMSLLMRVNNVIE